MSILSKIPPPVIALACALASIALGNGASHSIQAYAVSGLLCISAAIFGSLAIIAFRRNKTTIDPVNPHRAKVLVQSGVFRLSRNPMYLSLALLLGALASVQESPLATIPIAAFLLVMNFSQIPREEQALRRAFPDEFASYCAKTRRWI